MTQVRECFSGGRVEWQGHHQHANLVNCETRNMGSISWHVDSFESEAEASTKHSVLSCQCPPHSFQTMSPATKIINSFWFVLFFTQRRFLDCWGYFHLCYACDGVSHKRRHRPRSGLDAAGPQPGNLGTERVWVRQFVDMI